MSAQMYGADVAELERLAEQFRRTADELDSEGTLLTGILGRVSWLGDIATEFLGEWTSVQIPRIGLSTEFLRTAANELQKQAIEQAAASMGDGFLLAVTQCVSQPPDPGIAWEHAELALTNLLELGGLVEAWNALGDEANSGAGLALSAGGLLFGLSEAVFEAAGQETEALVAGLGDQLFSLISAVEIIVVEGKKLGPAAGWLGIAAGAYTFTKGAHRLGQDFGDGYAWADLVSGGLITAGSAIAMTGGGAPVGGALVLAGTAIQAGAWAVEHREEIREVWNEGFEVGRDALHGAGDALAEGARGVVGGAEVAGELISDGFDKLKGWF